MIAHKPGICYSGFRCGQSPRENCFPTIEHVQQDLYLLSSLGFCHLRMYEPNTHAEMVLSLIQKKGLPLRVMLGIDPLAEYYNPGCSWAGQLPELQYQKNAIQNERKLARLVHLARRYQNQMLAVSVGNENRPSWGSDLVSEERLIGFATQLHKACDLPVTYCEGAWEWPSLKQLAAALDFVCVHSYPQWNRVPLQQAVAHMQQDYARVSEALPNKPLVFSEFGWCTASNSKQMLPEQANEEVQTAYLNKTLSWLKSIQTPFFLFEGFDEPWKGSSNPQDPEKHWGIFHEDRTPKQVAREMKQWL